MADPSVELNRLTDAQVETLCLNFEIQSDHETVKNAIEVAGMWYEAAYRLQNQPPKKEQRKRLDAVRRHSKALRTALRELGERELLLLGRYDPYLSRHQLSESLRILGRAVNDGLHDVENAKSRQGDKTADDPGRELISRLMKIYRSETGQKPGYTQDPDSSEYSGPFIRFASQVFDMFGIEIKNRFLGDTVKEIKKVASS